MSIPTFEKIKGTKLHKYLENNDILNLYPSFNESIKKMGNLFYLDIPPVRMPTDLITCHNRMRLRRSDKNDRLIAFYKLLYHYDLSFIVRQVINTEIENEDPMDIEYIILFFLAIQYNDHTSIDMIISNGFDMNENGRKNRMRSDNYFTTTYLINKDMIYYLLLKGGDINNEYCKILNYACHEGDADFVNYLLNLNIDDDKLFAMFIISITDNNFTIADSIINYGFKIEDKYQEILDYGLYNANLESIQYLIQHGLDINRYGSYILSQACKGNKHRLVDFCLQHNLTVDQKTLTAVFNDIKLSIIEILAKNGVDLSVVKFKDTEYNFLIASLKNNGLDMILFTRYLLKLVEKIDNQITTFRNLDRLFTADI